MPPPMCTATPEGTSPRAASGGTCGQAAPAKHSGLWRSMSSGMRTSNAGQLHDPRPARSKVAPAQTGLWLKGDMRREGMFLRLLTSRWRHESPRTSANCSETHCIYEHLWCAYVHLMNCLVTLALNPIESGTTTAASSSWWMVRSHWQDTDHHI